MTFRRRAALVGAPSSGSADGVADRPVVRRQRAVSERVLDQQFEAGVLVL
jgi:hypothetical protein